MGSAQTRWGAHKREGKKGGGLTEGERWPQAWTPKIYDRSPPLFADVVGWDYVTENARTSMSEISSTSLDFVWSILVKELNSP